MNLNDGCFASDTVTIVGDRELISLSALKMQAYPNPSRGLYELSIENLRGTASIEVLGALGRQVYKGEVSTQGIKTQQQLDIRYVAAGVYTLRLQTSDGPKYLRLKKE